jgi:threonine/homoserine/homoserine lactone efflux protein
VLPDSHTFGLFLAATLALTLTPGPGVLYIVARSVEGGRPAGLASALGIGLGGLVHVAFAAVGLSVLLASSAVAFAAVKWLGVAYLVWLGLSRLLGGDEQGDAATPAEARNLSSVFWQGVLVDVLNPKVALFFLAFLPQFVDPSRGPAWAQVLLLGLTFAAVGLCTDSLYALLGGTAGGWLRHGGAAFRRWQRYLSGVVYLLISAEVAKRRW